MQITSGAMKTSKVENDVNATRTNDESGERLTSHSGSMIDGEEEFMGSESSQQAFAEESVDCKVDRQVTVDLGLGTRPIVLRQQFMISDETGGALWDSGRLLAQYLVYLKNSELEPGNTLWGSHTVIELGTGVGLVAITAAMLGARVLATDGDDSIVHITRENIHLAAVNENVTLAKLAWGDVENAQRLLKEWEGFDYILGSDLLYNSDNHLPLRETLITLCGPRTTILLAFRIRYPEREFQFIDDLESHFHVEWHCKGFECQNQALKFWERGVALVSLKLNSS